MHHGPRVPCRRGLVFATSPGYRPATLAAALRFAAALPEPQTHPAARESDTEHAPASTTLLTFAPAPAPVSVFAPPPKEHDIDVVVDARCAGHFSAPTADFDKTHVCLVLSNDRFRKSQRHSRWWRSPQGRRTRHPTHTPISPNQRHTGSAQPPTRTVTTCLPSLPLSGIPLPCRLAQARRLAETDGTSQWPLDNRRSAPCLETRHRTRNLHSEQILDRVIPANPRFRKSMLGRVWL